MKKTGIEEIYRHHHKHARGDGFILLGDIRGAFLRERIGTGKRVLDIGCRDGALTAQYASGNEVTGVDIDGAALQRAKERLGIAVVHMDLNSSWDAVAGGSFDVVVAAEVLEHLYYPDLVLEKIARVLKPGGILLGSVPNAFSLKNRVRLLLGQKAHTPLADPTHINHFSHGELQSSLSRSFVDATVFGMGHSVLAKYGLGLFAYGFLFYGRKK